MTTVRPTGRSEVMAAVLEAATDLFAEQGPSATSIRDVAARSGVNHGLVYRHFGTKEELVAAVLDHASDRFNDALTTASPNTGAEEERQWRVLARAILDGYPVGRLQHGFPFVERMVRESSGRGGDQTSIRLAVGHVIALELGWRLFEPFIRSAIDLESMDPDTLAHATNDLSRRILSEAGDEGAASRSGRPKQRPSDP